jgi:hypothetical protein
LRVLAVEHQGLADVLHRFGGQRRADLRQVGLALLAFVARRLHLDQLVALEVDVDLAQHRLAQSLAPDHHHRVQGMGAGLERLALCR